jgi:hypothetical protein
MGKQDNEIKRIQRIRDRQISARDPTAKDREFYGEVSARRKNARYSFKDALKDMQSKWTWMFAGGIIGLIAAIVFAMAVRTSWAQLVALVMIFAGLVIGRLLGAVMDWRNDDWTKR